MKDKIPKDYKDLPHFPNDQLSDDFSDGDIMIQACSMDDQVTFHAIHNLIRPFRDIVQVKWSQTGFVSGQLHETPRNLMAFKDGTVNPRHTDEYKDYVFIDDGWAKMVHIVLFDAYRFILKHGTALHSKNKKRRLT